MIKMIERNGQCKKNAYVDHLRHGLLEPKKKRKKNVSWECTVTTREKETHEKK